MQKPKCSNLLQEDFKVQLLKDNNERNKTWLFRFIVLIIFNIYSVLYMFLSIYLMYLIKVLVLWISLSLDEVIYWYRTSKTLQRLLLQRLPLRRLYYDAEKSVKTFLNRSILNEVDICSECRLHSVDMFCTYTAQTTAQLPPNFGEIGILINFLKQKGKLF